MSARMSDVLFMHFYSKFHNLDSGKYIYEKTRQIEEVNIHLQRFDEKFWLKFFSISIDFLFLSNW